MSMQSILSATQSVNRMNTIQSVRTQMQGKADVLRIESKQDGGDSAKEAQAATLDEKSVKLMDTLMSEASDVNETLRPDEEVKTETDKKAKEEDKAAASQPTDKVELSDSATEQLSAASPEKLAVGEAVTYKPDGSTEPVDAENKGSTFKAMA